MTKPYSPGEHAYWRQCWIAARDNMPHFYKGGRGSPVVLTMLLGYNTFRAAIRINGNIARGSRPRTLAQQKLLKALAGPHGSTIAKIAAIQRGLDLSKWKHWPKGG